MKKNKKLIVGNWKMNGSAESVVQLTRGIEEQLSDALLDHCDFLVCPSYVHASLVLQEAKNLSVGAQDCSDHFDGAVTGQVSASMLADIGLGHVILGHSECRLYRQYKDSVIAKKAEMAFAHNLHVLLCVGESAEQRERGEAKAVVKDQLERGIPAGADSSNLTVSYEPVWAIGTGHVASAEDIEEMHNFIRDELSGLALDNGNVRILYGGSMKPDNAAKILALPNVDGGLIGGAALNVDDFIAIGRAAI